MVSFLLRHSGGASAGFWEEAWTAAAAVAVAARKSRRDTLPGSVMVGTPECGGPVEGERANDVPARLAGSRTGLSWRSDQNRLAALGALDLLARQRRLDLA